jgi:transglutaminase-like putative cysteine protease
VKLLKMIALAFAGFLALAAVGEVFSASSDKTGPERVFEFTYLARIPALPANAQAARVWIPLPHSDTYQTIADVQIKAPFAYTEHRDPEYGNEYLYFQIAAANLTQPADVLVTFRAVRREHRVPLDSQAAASQSDPPAPDQRFLEADSRIPIQGVIADLSAQQTRGLQDPLAKARAIYNYVVATMRYDKSGTGWGNGDAIWACTAKRGNCTDFHSLFIGMMRAAGIPARFEIGFPLPTDQHDGAIPGYHCWAEFYVKPYGWIPVDASEAWKHPDLRDYFFGANDDNRVQFTIGRDLRLDPPQQGALLNYFIYPYAEVDGKPFALDSKFSFQDRQIAKN